MNEFWEKAMILFAEIAHDSSRPPEHVVGLFAIVVLICCGFWLFVRNSRKAPVQPDPWDETVTKELDRDESRPICHRCLAPHENSVDFCNNCGAPVGQYTNWMPFPYLFSVGHMLRVGTSGEFKKSRLNVFGFLLLGFVEYVFFAPIYWLVFFLHLDKNRPSDISSKLDSPVPPELNH